MASRRVSVAPSVLVWARETLNLSPSAAARKIGISEAVLARWESGTQAPTIVQLRKAAKAYKRPLAVLLLPSPPRDYTVPWDFREGPSDPSPRLIEEIRRAHQQREAIAAIADLSPDLAPPRGLLPSVARDASMESAGRVLRQFLNVSLSQQRTWKSPRDSLAGWISAAEARGILVIQTDRVAIDEALGFSIHAEDYPVIALNGSDWPRRKVFTLLHEIAHLALGSGAICDLHEAAHPSKETESFCNAIAAAALMPAEAMRSALEGLGAPRLDAWNLDLVETVSDAFGASTEATLLRLISLRAATWHDYERLRPELLRRYREAHEAQRARLRESKGGPSYYVIHSRNLGRRYTNTVLDAYHANIISSLDVADYLHIKYQQLPKFEAVA